MSMHGRLLTLLMTVGLCQGTSTLDASRQASSTLPSLGSTPAPPSTPDERANEAYASGLAHRGRGIRHEQDEAKARTSADRLKAAAKARREFEKALKDFQKANRHAPSHVEAYVGTGFAYRKLGDLTQSLAMYDRALRLTPELSDAIESRGELYLDLNRLDEAKRAYLQLLGLTRKNADRLMGAMRLWISARRVNPSGVDPATIDAFEAWVAEQGVRK
ncbi:MAG TPA: tetratricopeptide repeat protein [Vicinamibacterales bacterium]|nr:tetratricopeptide repeat protein [Vicinamibacterales bacterium]